MANDASDRIAQQVAEIYSARDRYAYYLLAIAGAAIAFTATQTSGAPLRWDHSLLGIAVLCWAFSFYCGCKNRTSHIYYLENDLFRSAATAAWKADQALLGDKVNAEVKGGVQELLSIIEGDVKAASESERKFFPRQFRALLAGIVFYVVWHVLNMQLVALNQLGAA